MWNSRSVGSSRTQREERTEFEPIASTGGKLPELAQTACRLLFLFDMALESVSTAKLIDGVKRNMAYQQVKEILDAVRRFHQRLRRELEEAYPDTEDPRSKFLLRSLRRGEQEMDLALGKYEKSGESSVLETWVQYVPSEDIEAVLLSGKIPSHSSPEDVLEWKLKFDESLATFYRQLADQIAAPRAKELFESLATLVEQRLSDQTWQTRDEDLAPDEDA